MKKRRKSKQTNFKSANVNVIVKFILAMLATAGCKVVVEVFALTVDKLVQQKLWSP